MIDRVVFYSNISAMIGWKNISTTKTTTENVVIDVIYYIFIK